MALRSTKLAVEAHELLQRYEAVLAVVRRVQSPKAISFVETVTESLRQIRELLQASPSRVPLSKILTGLRQGLRETPRMMQSVLAEAPPSLRAEVIEVVNGQKTPAFLEDQAEKARKVLARGSIRNEDEWYLLRWRLDQIEGSSTHRQECELLAKLLDTYESRGSPGASPRPR